MNTLATAKKFINAPLDPSLIKQRENGKQMFSYISGYVVMDILNKAFDYAWSWTVDKEWIEEGVLYFNKYAKVPDNEKVTVNGVTGAYEAQGPIAHVRGTLTVEYLDENGQLKAIHKTGYGSKCIIGKQAEQDSIFKSAGTDALKKAASMLGIGAQLYRNEEEQLYFDAINYDGYWTDDKIQQCKEAYDFIMNFVRTYSLTEQDMIDYVNGFDSSLTNGIESLTVENIVNFVDYINQLLASVEE